MIAFSFSQLAAKLTDALAPPSGGQRYRWAGICHLSATPTSEKPKSCPAPARGRRGRDKGHDPNVRLVYVRLFTIGTLKQLGPTVRLFNPAGARLPSLSRSLLPKSNQRGSDPLNIPHRFSSSMGKFGAFFPLRLNYKIRPGERFCPEPRLQ